MFYKYYIKYFIINKIIDQVVNNIFQTNILLSICSEKINRLCFAEYGTATQRLCLQRGPDDSEERCAYTVWNHKKVYMCLCYGDLCNGAMKTNIASGLMIAIIVCLTRLLV